MGIAAQPIFIRRTDLAPDEYFKNFHQIEHDVIEFLRSAEAEAVSRNMPKIYLGLRVAPARFWERDRILFFQGENREGKWLTSWEVLIRELDVSSATAAKALRWMNRKGVIGYKASKGVGIRVFLNRVASSIGKREQKILAFPGTSVARPNTSPAEASFKDNNVLDNLDPRYISAAETSATATPPANDTQPSLPFTAQLTEILTHSLNQAERSFIRSVQDALRDEGNATRDWLTTRVIPTAGRVAQAETYKLLKREGRGGHSVREIANTGAHPDSQTGHYADMDDNLLAEVCASIAKLHNRSVHSVVSEHMQSGHFSTERIERVGMLANNLLMSQGEGTHGR